MILVLRLGHRLPRDERMSTHICLVARAFGADSSVYSGQHDSSLEESVKKISGNWGGNFEISYEKNWKRVIQEYKKKEFTVVHLTMYGMPVSEKIERIRESENILVIVGAEQVPPEVYEMADYNISVTNQPHSEVAALAVFLDRLNKGKELERKWDENFNGKIKIEPSEKGKNVKK